MGGGCGWRLVSGSERKFVSDSVRLQREQTQRERDAGPFPAAVDRSQLLPLCSRSENCSNSFFFMFKDINASLIVNYFYSRLKYKGEDYGLMNKE